MKKYYLFFLVISLFLSCSQGPGEGGTSVIEGRVWKCQISESSFDTIIDGYMVSYPQIDTISPLMPDEGVDVFIIYSGNENDLYDDSFETDWNGRYHFEYLRKGDYTLYVMVDSTETIYNSMGVAVDGINYDYPIFRHVTIGSNNSTELVDDFFIIEKD
tara:strand:+ start:227 stop:703 length:477 start_codon:yes stop_codon:yes gene_type:complete